MISKYEFAKSNSRVLLFSIVCVLVAYVPFAYTEQISDEIWTFRFIYVLAVFGILPTGIVFYLTDFILKKSLNFQKEKMSNYLAVIYGSAIGFALLLTVLFLLWQYSNSTGYYLSFSEFLFTPKNTTVYLFNYEIKVNPFLTPNLITIISSPYLGWKINKAKSIENTLVTKE